jgi:SAM-dependent methyltransferase
VDIDDRVRDALPVNAPYSGLVAEAYDVWLPPDRDYGDVEVYRRAIERAGGPALELGCGNGRLLVRYVAAGLDVEGVDSSADMLAVCAGHARDAGVAITLHQADWTALALARRYALIYNPAGSLALVIDDDDLRGAIAVWRAHLEPGGHLMLSMGVPPDDDLRAQYEWRIRRSGTRASDGITFMVHEAFRTDTEAQLQHVVNRHEVWDPRGELVTTFVRRHTLRWWTRDQLADVLRAHDFADVASRGDESSFITVGRVPE